MDIQLTNHGTHASFRHEQFAADAWTSPSAFICDFWQKSLTAENPYQKIQGQVDRGEYCGRLQVDFSGFRDDVLEKDAVFTLASQNLCTFSGKEICGKLSTAEITAPAKLYEVLYRTEPQTVFTYRFEDKRAKDSTEGITVTLHLPRNQEERSNGYHAVTHFRPVLNPKDNTLIAFANFEQEEESDSFTTVLAVCVSPIGGKGRLRLNNESGGNHPGIRDKDPIMIGQDTETQLRFCLEPGCTGAEIFAVVLADKDGKYLPQFGENYVRKAAGIGFAQLLEQE